MKRSCRYIGAVIAAAVLLGGCNTPAAFEPQHKTETETVNVTDGMFPQVIEKSISSVQEEKDGEWKEESSEITKWELADVSGIQDSVWILNTGDAASFSSFLDDSFKDVSATVYFHFRTDLNNPQTSVTKSDDGSSRLDVSLNMTGDVVFICNGAKSNFYDVKFGSAEVYMDGSTVFDVDLGGGMAGKINIPSTVKKGELKAFQIAQSDTYFDSVSFGDLPTFDLSSANLNNGVWDTKITNTNAGENSSPELTWDKVDGATQYVVIMIDGTWLHMDVFTTETSLAEGAIGRGSRGEQYVGPYPPTGSTHTYSVFVFALKNEIGKVTLSFDNGANSIEKIYEGLDTDVDGNTGNVIAYARLDGNFTMK